MLPDSRRLNLSNTLAVVIYEARRQMGVRTGRYWRMVYDTNKKCMRLALILL